MVQIFINLIISAGGKSFAMFRCLTNILNLNKFSGPASRSCHVGNSAAQSTTEVSDHSVFLINIYTSLKFGNQPVINTKPVIFQLPE